MPLNPLCRRDEDMCILRCPLICFYAVEIHLPHRVARQFGLDQSWPPQLVLASTALHQHVFLSSILCLPFVTVSYSRNCAWHAGLVGFTKGKSLTFLTTIVTWSTCGGAWTRETDLMEPGTLELTSESTWHGTTVLHGTSCTRSGPETTTLKLLQ
jgi:hypothetical protein